MATPVKMGKFDQAYLDAASSKKLSKPREKQNVAVRVRKAIFDNCKDLSPDEIDVVRVNGVTLREQLTIDKQRDTDGEKVTFGKRYYAVLKSKYLSPGRLEQLLTPKPELPVSSAIFTGVAKALKHPPNRQYIAGALALCTTLGESDCRAVFLLLLKLNPAGSPLQRESAMVILQHLNRLEVFSNFPTETGLMKQRIDEILLQVRGGWVGKRKQRRNTQSSSLSLYLQPETVVCLCDMEGCLALAL